MSERRKAKRCEGIPARYILVIFIFLTSLAMYCQRLVLNVAIVAMVNQTAVSSVHNSTVSDECPDHSVKQNITYNYQEGKYVWSQPVQGIVLGSFFYGYVFGQIIGGSITFVFGPKRVFVSMLFISSVLVLITPLAADLGVPAISCLRVVMGIAQGFLYPAAYTMLAWWSPIEERATLMSISISGNQIGTVSGMTLTGYLCEYGFAGGWPSSFYVFGIFGIVLSIFVLFMVYEKPQQHPRISEKELNFLKENLSGLAPDGKNLSVPWKSVLTSRPVWVVAFTKVCWAWGFYSLLLKLPSYLEIVLHFPIQQNGLINALVYSADTVTILISGFLADIIARRNYFRLIVIRKIFETIGMLGPGVCILSVPLIGCDSTKAIILLTLSMGFFGFVAAGDVINIVDLAPDFSGALFGLTNGIACIPGFIAPYVAGILLEKDQGNMVQWSYVFYTAVVFYGFGFLLFTFGATTELQPWALGDPKKKITNKPVVENTHNENKEEIRTTQN